MAGGMLAWGSFIGLGVCAIYLVGHYSKNPKQYFTSAWNSFKYSYYLVIILLFSYLYVAYKLLLLRPIFGDMETGIPLFIP